jgi:hypothetical protein
VGHRTGPAVCETKDMHTYVSRPEGVASHQPRAVETPSSSSFTSQPLLSARLGSEEPHFGVGVDSVPANVSGE